MAGNKVVALTAGMAPGRALVIYFLSLKKESIKILELTVEPRPLASQAGLVTTTLPARWLLELENFKTINCYPYYFIRANRIG